MQVRLLARDVSPARALFVLLALVASSLTAVATSTPTADALGNAGFHPLTPARVLDTRDGTGAPRAKVGQAGSLELDVVGVGGVPNEHVSGVVLNVTAVLPDHASHITVWPTGVTRPVASNLNVQPGDIAPNLVVVKVGADGKVSLFNNEGNVDLIADVVGWFDDGSLAGDRFAGVTPARILDTRDGIGGPATRFGPAAARDLDVTGVGGVPATGASAVVLNVTAVNGSATSHVTVWPKGLARPDASNLNFFAGKVRPNLVVVKIGADGSVSLFNNSGNVDLIADVVGWFGPEGTIGLSGGGFQGVTPARVLDTREAIGGPLLKIGPAATRTLEVTGVGGVPALGVGGVVLNVTAVNGSAESHLTVWPSDVSKPTASNLNFAANQVIPNLVMVKTSVDGTVDLYNNSGNVDVIADVVGWYAAPTSSAPGGDPAALAPPLDPGVPVDFATSTAFLTSGPNRIQFGVAPGAIDGPRSTVVRGRVVDGAGAPRGGVRVDARQRQDVGYTLTRADGWYDFVVNGGTPTLLRYSAPGLLPAQRWAPAPAGDYAFVDDVALLQESAVATTVTDGQSGIQVVQGEESSDARGVRRSTLLVPPNQDATLRMPDGSVQDVASLTIRTTEYTVGDEGEAAMPGELPSTSGYTYAVEHSADEGEAVGATRVEFSQPMIDYVDNFLGFAVGAPVPNGSYDRELGQWVAEPGGVVVGIVSIISGVVSLDVTGDGVADSGTALTDLGITTVELGVLGSRYPAGASLWRVPLSHFTPHDYNQFLVCSTACEAPAAVVPPPKPVLPPKDPCLTKGSVIGCQGQTLGEAIPIVGTGLSLNYQSGNTPGYVDSSRVDIVATSPTPSASLVEVKVDVDVAGQHHEFPVSPAPDQHVVFSWDGKDAYGRLMGAATTARVTIHYVFDGTYLFPERDAFGEPVEGGIITPVPAPKSIKEKTVSTVDLGGHRPPGADVGGWSIDRHHVYQQGHLYTGSGEVVPIGAPTGVVNGTGLDATAGVASRDGSSVILSATQVRRRTAAGVVTVIAGTGAACGQATVCGEGGPATAAPLTLKGGIAEGPDGSIYVVEGVGCIGFICAGQVVRRIAPNGILTTVAGNGATCADPYNCGRGVPATSVPIDPSSIAVDAAGVLWILETFAGATRIRAVGVDGRIRTLYGCLSGVCGFGAAQEGDAAPGALLRAREIAVDPRGGLLLREEANGGRILRIDERAIIHVIAGGMACGGGSACGDFGPALTYRFGFAASFAVGADGAIYVQDSAPLGGHKLMRFQPGGDIEVVAGGPGTCNHLIGCKDGELATNALMSYGTVSVGRDGTIYLIGVEGFRTITAARKTPDGMTVVPSADLGELYVFDPAGRHQRTVDGRTGVVLRAFGYTAGRLTTIVDQDANTTTIDRTADGTPTAIRSPYGVVTTLTVDAAGHLATVVAPGALTTTLATTPSGLLTGLTEPGAPAPVHAFTYDAAGLLLTDTDGTGGVTTLARTALPAGHRVTLTDPDGRATTYDTTVAYDRTRTVVATGPTGAATTKVMQESGDSTITFPDGEAVTQTVGKTARFGFVVPVVQTQTETVPGGPPRVTTIERTVTQDPADITKVLASGSKITTNGKMLVQSYDGPSRTFTIASPEGRDQSITYDVKAHIVSNTPAAGVAPVTYGYDARGRVVAAAQGPYSMAYEYDSSGRQSAEVDAQGRRRTFAYNAQQRLTGYNAGATGADYTLGRDARANVTSVTTPGGGVQQIGFDLSNRQTSATGAGAPTATATYTPGSDLLHQVVETGDAIDRTYDTGGRLTGISYPGVDLTYTYVGATGQLDATTWDGAEAQVETYTRQGSYITGISMSGAADADFTVTWDGDRRLASRTLAGPGGGATAFIYDDDGLLVNDGPFAIGRTGPGGQASSYSDGTANVALGYEVTGDQSSRTLTFGATTAFAETLIRDATGRVTTQTVVAPSGSTATVFTYDSVGRLVSSKQGAGPVKAYSYDGNGNLTSATSGTATFTARDQIATVGATAYTYDANGSLTDRGADSFTRDASGELLAATVGGTSVQYRYDAASRRTARIEGAETTEYLYGDPSRPSRLTASRRAGGVTSYLYDDANRLLAIERSGTRFYVGTDHLGSPRVVRDAAGSTVKEIQYDPWGNLLADSNPSFDLVPGFAGGIADPVTALVRFGLRDYEPATGRFTTIDPAGLSGGYNQYAYGSGDPVNRIDPDGLGEIGFSFFFLVGAGVKVGWGGPKGFSICSEYGVGLGGGVEVTDADASEPKRGVAAELSAGIGVASIGGAVETAFDDCGVQRTTASAGLGALGLSPNAPDVYNHRTEKWEKQVQQVSFSKGPDLAKLANFKPRKIGWTGKVVIRECY